MHWYPEDPNKAFVKRSLPKAATRFAALMVVCS